MAVLHSRTVRAGCLMRGTGERRDHWEQRNGCLVIWHEGTSLAETNLCFFFFWYEKHAFIQQWTQCFQNTTCKQTNTDGENRKWFKQKSSFSASVKSFNNPVINWLSQKSEYLEDKELVLWNRTHCRRYPVLQPSFLFSNSLSSHVENNHENMLRTLFPVTHTLTGQGTWLLWVWCFH